MNRLEKALILIKIGTIAVALPLITTQSAGYLSGHIAFYLIYILLGLVLISTGVIEVAMKKTKQGTIGMVGGCFVLIFLLMFSLN